MSQISRFAAYSGILAAISAAATPASAAELPRGAHPVISAYTAPAVFDEGSLKAHRHRYWRYRRHNHVHAGDVLAGVLIIGGIAAIANAASNSQRRESEVRYRDYRDGRDDYRDRRNPRRSSSGRGIDGAVDKCMAEIERDVRVDSVDSVNRSGDGWRVEGSIYDGSHFVCDIDENGRIERVDYGGGFAAAPAEDNQHSDERYRAAWASIDGAGQPATSDESAAQLPSYPGGPVDGDLEGDAGDDRYTMAQTPTG